MSLEAQGYLRDSTRCTGWRGLGTKWLGAKWPLATPSKVATRPYSSGMQGSAAYDGVAKILCGSFFIEAALSPHNCTAQHEEWRQQDLGTCSIREFICL